MVAGLLLGCLIWAAPAEEARAQDVAATHYDWTPEQFTSEQYFVRKLREVGNAVTMDVHQALDCDLLTFQRIGNSSGTERVLNGAIWTSFAVVVGNFRERGATFTPEMEALIRSTLSAAALQGAEAQTAFARLNATPGGLAAREAECVAAFNQAAGANRAYFEQRSQFVTTRQPQPANWTVEQLRSEEVYAQQSNYVAGRMTLDADANIECQMVEVLGIAMAQRRNEAPEVMAWRRQRWGVFDVRRQMLQNAGAVISADHAWMTRALSDAAAWQTPESRTWQRGLSPTLISTCEQAIDDSLQDSRPFFEQRANLARAN